MDLFNLKINRTEVGVYTNILLVLYVQKFSPADDLIRSRESDIEHVLVTAAGFSYRYIISSSSPELIHSQFTRIPIVGLLFQFSMVK